MIYIGYEFISKKMRDQKRAEKKKGAEAVFREKLEIRKIQFQNVIKKLTSSEKSQSIHVYNPETYQPYIATTVGNVYDIEKKSGFKYTSNLNPGTIYDDFNAQPDNEPSSIQRYVAKLKQNAKVIKQQQK